MRRIPFFLFFILLGYIGLVCYANRALYTSHFDATYWKDKYDHSQWKLPLSQRTLGDDGLYLYEGYRLIHGEDPTILNAEVPPLGKYTIGLSILLFQNGYVYGFIATTLALLAFFFLSALLINNGVLATIVTILFATDPLMTKQFSLTMLESPQLLFLLLSVIFTILTTQSKKSYIKFVWVTCAGASLGLFAEIKFPLFAPVIGLILLWTLWKKTGAFRLLWFFILSAIFSYIAPYVPYFFMGHTFIDFLKVQKWIVAFYMQSGLQPTFGSVFTTLLLGQNQNIFTHTFDRVREWSPIWPFITLLGIFQSFRQFTLPITLLVVVLLLFHSIIPFWTRYLILVLPFLYIGTILFSKKLPQRLRYIFLGILLFINITSGARMLFPSPRETVAQFTSDWEHGFFQDMFERTTTSVQSSLDRTTFHRIGRTFFFEAQIEEAEVRINPFQWKAFASPQYIPLHITYKTRHLGIFEVKAILEAVKENGRWRINWRWDNLLEGFSPTTTLETSVDLAKRGAIFAKNGLPLVADKESVMVWLNPSKVVPETENALFLALETLFEKRIKAVHFHERYVRLGDLGLPIPMGVLMREFDTALKTTLFAHPALSTTPVGGRFLLSADTTDVGHVANALFSECCSLLYSASSYEGVDGLEKIHNATLAGENGGVLILKNSSGTVIRTVIQKDRRDGQNVRLDY